MGFQPSCGDMLRLHSSARAWFVNFAGLGKEGPGWRGRAEVVGEGAPIRLTEGIMSCPLAPGEPDISAPRPKPRLALRSPCPAGDGAAPKGLGSPSQFSPANPGQFPCPRRSLSPRHLRGIDFLPAFSRMNTAIEPKQPHSISLGCPGNPSSLRERGVCRHQARPGSFSRSL